MRTLFRNTRPTGSLRTDAPLSHRDSAKAVRRHDLKGQTARTAGPAFARMARGLDGGADGQVGQARACGDGPGSVYVIADGSLSAPRLRGWS